MNLFTSSVLLIGTPSENLDQIGADWVPSLTHTIEVLEKNPYPVIVSFFNSENLQSWIKIKNNGLIRSQDRRIFIIDKNDLKSITKAINDFHPFKIITEYEISTLVESIKEALEDYHLFKQKKDLQFLLESQNFKLKNLTKDLDEKVQKRQSFLNRAKMRLSEANIYAESFHSSLVSIHKSHTVIEIEDRLKLTLGKSLGVEQVTINNDLSEIKNTYIVPLNTNDKYSNKIGFIRALREFSSKEKELLNQIAEVVSLAINRINTFELTKNLKQQWESTFDAIKEPLCICDKNFLILKMNKFFQVQSEKPFHELVGINCFDALSLSKDHDPPPNKSGFYRWRSAFKNTYKTYDIHIHELHSSTLEEEGFLILFRDKTDQEKIEKQIIESAKLAELGTISSSIAHELNNPLGGILSFLQLIKMDLSQDNPLREDILAMEEAGLRCKAIVEDLLGFARDQSGGENSSMDVKDLVAQLVKILELQTRSSGVHIEIIEPKEPVYYQGNSILLSQALRNILQNSLEAIQEKLQSHPGFKGEVQIQIESDDENVKLKISDNGPGIKSQILSKIFNPLFTTKNPDTHSGLGLTVAFKNISDQNGSLEIQSRLGSGATALITLKRPDLKADSQVFDLKI